MVMIQTSNMTNRGPTSANLNNHPPSSSIKLELNRGYGISSRVPQMHTVGPDGRKIRAKPQYAAQPGGDVKMLDYRTGKMMQSLVKKPQKPAPYDHARGVRQDASLMLPIRQTASIFKQPVTVIRNHDDSKTQTDLKHGPQDTQPRQLFWEKGLQGLQACDSSEEVLQCLEFPTIIHGVGPDLSTENVIQSIAAALHLTSQPIIGQSSNRIAGHKNLGVTLDTNQPHMQYAVITESDVRNQENKVKEMRQRLTQAFKGVA